MRQCLSIGDKRNLHMHRKYFRKRIKETNHFEDLGSDGRLILKYTYLLTYLLTYIPTYLLTYILTYLLTLLLTYLLLFSYLFTYLLT